MAEAALIASIVGGVSAVAGVVQQRKASKEQRRQTKIKGRIAATRRMRDIKRNIAASRVRRGEVQAAGFQLGVAGSSAVSGAVSGIQADVGGAIGASQQQFTGQQVVAGSQDIVSGFQQSAATFGAITSLTGQFGEQEFASIGELFNT